VPPERRGTPFARTVVMNLREAIYTRRAVRAYTAQTVDAGTVETLLHAAVQAPSAMNRQPWRFAIVQHKARLAAISARAKAMLIDSAGGSPGAKVQQYLPMLRNPAFNIFYDAGTLIAIGVADHGSGQYADADCWLAAANLMLTARDLGLGSCCIGFAVAVLNTPDLKRELGFPEDGAIVAPVIVGYPATQPPPVTRTEPRIAAWIR